MLWLVLMPKKRTLYTDCVVWLDNLLISWGAAADRGGGGHLHTHGVVCLHHTLFIIGTGPIQHGTCDLHCLIISITESKQQK